MPLTVATVKAMRFDTKRAACAALPLGCTFTAGVAAGADPEYFATVNSYSAADWAKMEATGALFLPAAGYRDGTVVYNVGGNGFYWSATPYDEDDAYYLDFYSNTAVMGLYFRYSGESVRLVLDLP